MSTDNLCTGSNKERKFEIRQAADGFSLFTWSDYGGDIGLIHWREHHGLSWQTAYKAAGAWVNNGEFPLPLRAPSKPSGFVDV